MLKVGNKIRFGHQIFIVECIKNNNILLNNNNILNWFSFDDIKKNCQKIQFNKPQNLSESFKNLNENVKNSLVFENDYVKIIARPIFETAYSNVYYHGSPVNNINKFKTPSFWSSDINFAEQYGKWVYIAQLDLSNCFDLSSKSHYEWLESKVGKIKYYDDMYNIHYYNSWMDFKNDDINFLDNWEITEQYLDIIKKSFNSVLLTEGGTNNVAILDNKLIHLIKKQPRNLDEGYVKRKSEFGNTGVMFDNDYIEFEEGMSYIDENNIKWTIVAINTDKDGEQICRVESEDGKTDIISSFILNIDIFDLDIKHPIYDERFFKKEDIAHTNQQNNINESSEIVIYTQNKIYRKIYECNKFDAISDFKKTFNYYNTLIPQYLKNNGFLEESLFYATQWKDKQGDDIFFTILKNPTKKEFNDLLKNSKNKQLRAIVGPHFNDDIYVWDAYYGTHDDIFRRYIYPVDKKFRDGFANVMFRKNDYDIWGFTFSDWFNKLGYNSKDNSTNTIPKEKWEELYADDDLGLLDESNNLKYNQTIVSEENKQEFLQILAKHRQLVNYYASKVGKNYPNHDLDKLKPDMFIPYVKGFVIGKQSLNPNEWKEFKNTQDKHYKQASHHSQFWDKSWTHDGQIPDVCGKMPDDAIIEMCADWCAMSKKYGNTPFEWADENINKLWKFDKHQINLIYKTLHKMWDTSNNFINESKMNIYESIASAYMENGVMYEVLKNPSKKELLEMLKKSKYKALRVVLLKNGDFYVADSYAYDHDSIENDCKINGYRGWYDKYGFAVTDFGVDYFDPSIIDTTLNVFQKYRERFGKEVKDNFIRAMKEIKKDSPNFYNAYIKNNNEIKKALNESSLYGGVNWQNNMKALGNVPATIGHNLFATMFPFQFLKLCPPYSYGDDDWFDKQLNERVPYGIPFLKVDVDEKNKKLIVTNHEGRHRIASVKRKEPNVDIPVAILYNKDRYTLPDINTLRKEWSIVSQDGNTEFKVGQFSLYNELPQRAKYDLYDIYKDKQINESIFYKGDFYDDWTEENKYLTIWKNPSAEWIKNSFSKTAYGAFRFFYNSKNKTLFIWDADKAVHGVINDNFDIDGDIAGTLCDNNEVLIWIYISPDEDFENAVRITKEKFGWFLEQLYGNLDNIKWGIND